MVVVDGVGGRIERVTPSGNGPTIAARWKRPVKANGRADDGPLAIGPRSDPTGAAGLDHRHGAGPFVVGAMFREYDAGASLNQIARGLNAKG